jgi:hypothetical protein
MIIRQTDILKLTYDERKLLMATLEQMPYEEMNEPDEDLIDDFERDDVKKEILKYANEFNEVIKEEGEHKQITNVIELVEFLKKMKMIEKEMDDENLDNFEEDVFDHDTVIKKDEVEYNNYKKIENTNSNLGINFDTGIGLEEANVKKISGPVSFYLLTPNKDKFLQFKKKGVKLPILFLFGDEHYSSSKMCDNCGCSVNDKLNGNCCYEIGSPDFLKLMDSMATLSRPVNFFVEAHFDTLHISKFAKDVANKTKDSNESLDIYKNTIKKMIQLRQQDEGIKEKNPLDLLAKKYTACYLRESKMYSKEIEKECPTKNVKWHLTDVRMSQLKGYVNKYYFDNLLSTFFTENRLTFINKFSFYDLFDKNITALEVKNQINGMFELIQEYTNKSIEECIEIFDLLLTFPTLTIKQFCEFYVRNSHIKKTSLVHKQISQSILDLSSTKIDIASVLEKAFLQMLKQTYYSEIMNSYTEEFRNHMKTMKNYIIDYCKEKYINNNTIQTQKYSLKILYKCKEMESIFSTKKIDEILTRFGGTCFGAVLVDLYTIFRTLKVPKNYYIDSQALFNFYYFGNFHIIDMVYILNNCLNLYDIHTVVEKKTNSNFRCLTIPSIISMKELEEKYGFQIDYETHRKLQDLILKEKEEYLKDKTVVPLKGPFSINVSKFFNDRNLF